MERKNKGSLSDSKYDKIMCGLNIWIGYYRANPVRFLIDYYGIAWSMEMDSLFFGSSEKAFYNFETVDKIRKIQRALYPK